MTEPRIPTRQELLELKGSMVLVPTLLALFGERFRNHQSVPRITSALTDVGLVTVPSFATCGNRAEMLVVAAEAVMTVNEEDEDEDEGELSPGTLPQHSFKIGDFPSARTGICSVTESQPLAQATYLMRTKNYSQIPVINGTTDLRGVITWSSVAARYDTGTVPTLLTAMVTDALPVAEVHHEFFAYLPVIRQHNYLLVRDNTGALIGIITLGDVAGRFQDTAQPFFLVGEIEFMLRRCLGARLSEEAVRAVQKGAMDTRSGVVADLMFGQYVKLLDPDLSNATQRANADDNWGAMGWTGVDRTQFVHQLNRVRQIRNKIAHFDSEPLTSQQIEELEEFAGLLKQLA